MAVFAKSWRRELKRARKSAHRMIYRLLGFGSRASSEACVRSNSRANFSHCLVRFRSTGACAGVSSASARASSRCRINWPRLSAGCVILCAAHSLRERDPALPLN